MTFRKILATGTALALMMPMTAAAQAMSAEEAEAMRAQLAALKAQVDRLEARLNSDAATQQQQAALAAAAPAPAPQVAAKPASETVIGWKGGPVFTKGAASFHVKGRIQYDAGLLMAPDGVDDRAKGYSNELRRLRLGGEGQLGGGFGYKLELELSDNSVDLVDTYITYEKGKWLVTLGNQNAFQSLDELISDTAGSVMERAAFTDAFGFERRLGLSAQYRSGILLAQAGIFSDSADSLMNSSDGANGGDENNSYGVDGRIVLAPKMGKTQLHFGLSGHWRDFQRLSSVAQRYRQRPFIHTVNSRFLATPGVAGDGESHYGAEFAGVRGPLWWAGEAHWLRVSRPGVGDPTFFGGYGEVGYVLTGETRSYKNGIFGTVKPDRPVGSGGWGALQATLRYDYLDLNDKDIVGGTQKGVIAALVWTPIDYLRFNVNYAHMDYTDAAILAGGKSDYGVDVIGWRAELDF
ncbi:phosphate-selective porin OprO/OprP [Sphingobium sp. OAS761]|uniref:OprO/OprP family phosphate-selective porin n=1 Tax=Sphingobium sp. OAS761 TaxID=2817901 RepID=UPI00209E75C5|nr:porin [Sphingobium sp. OAS761]MCP1471533.1 phosphate-selective porin OprO/OprP [Sphingobium sp. OAS761]